MGSLLIEPFSCTHPPTKPHHSKINMKTFTTLAALLGATNASPIQQIQYGSTGLQHSGVTMMTNQKMHPTSTQHMTMATHPMMKVVAEMPQPVVNPNQYHLKDNLGNYAFGYSTQNSEMAEEGNAQLKKGHYANIMADGKLRRVDYIADNQGFHILRDTADNTGKYIKREAETSVEPDLIRTRMTSYMDSSSLRNDNNMHQMSNNQMGQDMSSSMMQRNNRLTSNMYKANNLVGRDMSTMNMMGNEMSSMNNMMGRDMSSMNNMMGRDMSSIEMMDRDMSSMNMMGLDKSFMNMMGRDMLSRNKQMGHEISSRNNMMGQGLNNMMGRDMSSMNMMGQDMSSRNMMGQGLNNMMGHDMSGNQMSHEMSSNLMGGDMYSNNMVSSNMMSQRMQIETMPSQSLNRFF